METPSQASATPVRVEVTGWKKAFRDNFIFRWLLLTSVFISIAMIPEIFTPGKSFNELLHHGLGSRILDGLVFSILYEVQKRYKWFE